jgi:hypothetical protein
MIGGAPAFQAGIERVRFPSLAQTLTRSSVGSSSSLIMKRSWVQSPPGQQLNSHH